MFMHFSSGLWNCNNLLQSEDYCNDTMYATTSASSLAECESWCANMSESYGRGDCCSYNAVPGNCSFYPLGSPQYGTDTLKYAGACTKETDYSCKYGSYCSSVIGEGICVNGTCYNSCNYDVKNAFGPPLEGKGCSVDDQNYYDNTAGTCVRSNNDPDLPLICDYQDEVAYDSSSKLWMSCQNTSFLDSCHDAGGEVWSAIMNGVCALSSTSASERSCSYTTACKDTGLFTFYYGSCYYCDNGAQCDSNVSNGQYSADGICALGSSTLSIPCAINGVCLNSTGSYRENCSYCADGDACDTQVTGGVFSADGNCSAGVCVPTTPATPILYWATNDVYEYNITDPQVWADIPHSYKAIAKNIGAPGDIVSFDIKEQDSGLDSDDEIWTQNAVVDADGNAKIVFQIDSGNLTKATGSSDEETSINDGMEFYFKTNITGTTESPILNFTYRLGACASINTCEDYATSSVCNADDCNVSSTCPTGSSFDSCACKWDDSTGTCNQVGYVGPGPYPPNSSVEDNTCIWCINEGAGVWCDMPGTTADYCDTTSSCSANGGTNISDSNLCTFPDFTIGWCVYTNDQSIDPQGCANDGYLTYGWAGTWKWNELANSFSSNPDTTNFTQDPLGTWRYAPINEITGLRASDICNSESGVNNVLCPAQIQLPFLGKYTIISIIILILVIYLIWEMKKKHKGKKKKK